MSSNLVNREASLGMMQPMRNTKGVIVERYMPKKCSATSKILGPKDHSAVSIFVPDVDENGRIVPGKGQTLNICGYIRDKARSDMEIMKLLTHQGVYPLPERSE